MELLFFLIAVTIVIGVVVMPAVRRRQERREFERAAEATQSMSRPPRRETDGQQAEPGVSLSKDGDQPPADAAPGTADGFRLPDRSASPGGSAYPGDSASSGGSLSSGGLVAVEDLDPRLPGPDDELVNAISEAQRTQDWRPAGQLLALTDDRELRWQRVQSLAGAAAMELAQYRATHGPEPTDPATGTPAPDTARDAGWLRTWRAEEPRDPGGAQVYAQFLAWQGLADTGSADSQIVLEEARAVCQEAARLDSADPTPHITELFVARGLGYRKADFESVWSEVTRRQRDHMGAHLVALTYWSEQWHGSKDEAYGFAQSAAGNAPPQSLLPALPLFAVYDHLPDIQLSPTMYQGAVIADAIEAAQFALRQVPPEHPVVPHVHHMLLCFLVRAGRFDEAAEHVWAVDGYVGALPWVSSPEPAQEYAAYRANAIGRR